MKSILPNRKEMCHNNYNQPYKLLNRNSNVFLLNFRSFVRIKITLVHISEIYKHHTGQQMQTVSEPSWISWWVHRISDPHIKNLCVKAPIYTRMDAKMLFHHSFLSNIGLDFLFVTHAAFSSFSAVSPAALLSLWPSKIKHLHGFFFLHQSRFHLIKLIVSWGSLWGVLISVSVHKPIKTSGLPNTLNNLISKRFFS